jgi:hypothetical protein
VKDRDIVSVYWHGAAPGFGRDRGTLLAGRDQNGIAPSLSVFGESDGRTPARRRALPSSTARHIVTAAIRQPSPPPATPAAPMPLRAKQLRRCACGRCGLFVLLQPGQDPRAAAYVEGPARTPNPERRRRYIGTLAAAARVARQERSA